MWPDRVWAIDGSNGAGRPLAQRLLEAGEHVVDVPAKLAARVRLFDTGHNRKTDARDAHSIAIVAVRTNTLRVLRADGELEALRMLCDRRELEPVGDAGTRMTLRNRGQPPGFTGIAAPRWQWQRGEPTQGPSRISNASRVARTRLTG